LWLVTDDIGVMKVVAGLQINFAASALLAAHRFLSAATMAALPASLSFLLGFDVVVTGSDLPLDAAHRLRWASAIAFRPEALIFRRLRGAVSARATELVSPPFSIWRKSAI